MTAVTCLLCQQVMLLALSDPDRSIEAGREALDQWGRYPWYDAETDSVRQINFPDSGDVEVLVDVAEGPTFTLVGGMGLQVLGWLVIGALLVGLAYLLIRAYLMWRPPPRRAAGDARARRDGRSPVGRLPRRVRPADAHG